MAKPKRPVRRKPAAIPPDPPGFTPIPPGSMDDLSLLPQWLRLFEAKYDADHEWVKEMLRRFVSELDTIKRINDRQDADIASLWKTREDHEKRIAALEAQTPQGEARKGQDQ